MLHQLVGLHVGLGVLRASGASISGCLLRVWGVLGVSGLGIGQVGCVCLEFGVRSLGLPFLSGSRASEPWTEGFMGGPVLKIIEPSTLNPPRQ